MRQNKEMQALILRLGLEFNLVCADTSSRINLLSKFSVLFQFKAISNFAQTLMFHVALFEDQGSVLLHFSTPLLSLLVCLGLNLDFLYRHKLFAL